MKYAKLLIGASALSLVSMTSTTFALPTGDLYVGLQGGLDILGIERNVTVQPIPDNDDDDVPPPLTQYYKFHDYGTGGVLGAYFGYDQPLSQYFDLAAEIEGNFDGSSAETSSTNTEGFSGPPTFNVDFKEKMRGEVGFSLLPGIIWQGAKVYGKFGVHKGKFDYTSSGNTVDDQSFNGSFSEWLTGYGAGFGTSIPITSQVALRLEYDYIRYKSVTRSSTDAINLNSSVDTTKFTPTSNLVLVGLEYKLPVSFP